jgi:hypothetical protein
MRQVGVSLLVTGRLWRELHPNPTDMVLPCLWLNPEQDSTLSTCCCDSFRWKTGRDWEIVTAFGVLRWVWGLPELHMLAIP